jgi:hypothetical protein
MDFSIPVITIKAKLEKLNFIYIKLLIMILINDIL